MTDPNKIFSKEESCLPLNTMMDYIHDRLANKERNHVERHLLQCNFCNEAIDGLALVDETRGQEIIESIDEANLLEDQILYAASFDESNYVEESKVEYELAAAPMASMSSEKKMRKAESVGGTVALKENRNDSKSFEWRRIAASVALVLCALGGLYYFINHNTNPANTNIALSKKEGFEEPVKKKEVTDSVIAISPQVYGNAIESRPNSDAVFNKQENARTFAATEVKADEEVKNEILQEEELITPEVANERAMMAALAKGEVKEASKLLDAEEAEKDGKKLDSYSMKSVGGSVVKAKKSEPRAASAVVAADTIVQVEKNINSDFDKGLQLYAKGEYQKATKYFEKISKTDAKYEEARWYLAKNYLVIGEKEKAKSMFKEIVGMNGVFKERAEVELKKMN